MVRKGCREVQKVRSQITLERTSCLVLSKLLNFCIYGQCAKKQRHHFVYKGLYSQGYGISNSHVWMWELDHNEGRMPKNWYFWTVVLEKTIESLLEGKEDKPVILTGNQPWILIRRTDGEAEASILLLPDLKNWLIGKDPDAGKDWKQKEKRVTEDEMMG